MATWVGERRVLALGTLAALAASVVLSCGNGKRAPTSQTPPRDARPSLRLLVMTDVSGYLEPCGCQRRPLGGIDKAAARMRELRADGVPTLFVSAGNLFFAADAGTDPKLEGGDAEAALQQTWQAETLAKVFAQLSLAGAAPGPADLRFGASALQRLAESGGFPLLGAAAAADAPARPTGEGSGRAATAGDRESVLVTRGGIRVGVWGLSDQAAAGRGGVADLAAKANRLTAELRKQGAAIVVGLFQGEARSARRLAAATRGLDFLLHGGSDSPEVVPPERVGDTTLLRAAHRGHGFVVVDIVRTGDGPLIDVSTWTQKAQKQVLQLRVQELEGRIAEWRRDANVDQALLAQQETRLVQMRGELSASEGAERARGNTFSARFVELGPETPSDPETRALLDAHNRRVNQHSREALAKLLPKPVRKGEPAYVGSERCGACHEAEHGWWQGHAHGHAYATLEKRNTQFNLSCVGCHVTGYNQPGGSTVVHNQGLTNVGCESCHGPGSLHAANPDVDEAKNVRREVPEPICKTCHNPEHSDHFEYATYRAKLIVKGHGL
jgi:hypothetical protein